MTTKERVVELRKRNPCLSSSDIGRIVGVSRQWVNDLLRESGLPTTRPEYWKKERHCLVCDKRLTSDQKKFCSQKHAGEYFREHSLVTLVCTDCGNTFTRKISCILDYDSRSQNRNTPGKSRTGLFCNKKCYGHWLGTHHHSTHKYDWEDILRMAKEGKSYREICRKHTIPSRYLKTLLYRLRKSEKENR
jgi:hypothetical protein